MKLGFHIRAVFVHWVASQGPPAVLAVKPPECGERRKALCGVPIEFLKVFRQDLLLVTFLPTWARVQPLKV